MTNEIGITNELLAEVSLLRNKIKKYEEAIEKIKEEIKIIDEHLSEVSKWTLQL